MTYIFKILIFLIDIFNKKKIINFLKKKINNKEIIIIDVGAHTGETVDLFYKNFKLRKIICYEASKLNFEKLKANTGKMKFKDIVEINNIGIGKEVSEKKFNQTSESSSSTFCEIDHNSSYFRRKKKILNFFIKGDYINSSEKILIKPLSSEFQRYNFQKIDILKIDTEGYELNVIEGLGKYINHFRFLYFEHHYDNMILKGYTFSKLNSYLNKYGFRKSFKVKMPFRKTFEYIYENKNFY
tara:strand:- start:165 stop:887 length:723 start_codon:yes stop_codon:yes gene_type:complete